MNILLNRMVNESEYINEQDQEWIMNILTNRTKNETEYINEYDEE